VIEKLSVRLAGLQRTGTVIRPDMPGPHTACILVFHGSNQTADSFRAFTGNAFDLVAQRDHVIVVYLNGHRKHWNDARTSINFAARRSDIDDTAFARAVMKLMTERFGVDPEKFFVTGFSNGGQMAIRLAHEIPDMLAGLAIISATQPVAENFKPDFDLVLPLPTVLFHGTEDPIVPYDGGLASMWGFSPRGAGMSAPETAQYFATRNGISTRPSHTAIATVGGSKTAIRKTEFRQRGHHPVTLFTVAGGGHVVPGRKRTLSIMGRSTDRLSAADAIWNFFTATLV
jgi:polyhydroxybutyrate depolymerase